MEGASGYIRLLGKARELSKVTGHPVYALFMGNGIEAAAHELLHYNVDKVFVYDAPELARFRSSRTRLFLKTSSRQ